MKHNGKPQKKYRSFAEVERARQERNAQRTVQDWEKLAREIIYRQLAMAERSEAQLLEALARRDVPQDIAQETLAKFVEAGLVDDLRFAKMYVRSVFHTKQLAARSLQFALQKRGISAEIAQMALSEIAPESELAAAIEFAQRKAAAMRSLTPQVARRRLYGQLARRGFSTAQIKQALEAAFSAAAEADFAMPE